MHVIVDHSMHDERSSSNFANFNGINRNIQLRFCIEYQAKVTYIYIYIQEYQKKSVAFSQRVVGGRCWRYGFGRIPKYYVINIYLQNFLFKRSSKINRQNIQIGGASFAGCQWSHSINITYQENISKNLSKNTTFMCLDVQLVETTCNVFLAIPQLFNDLRDTLLWKTLTPNATCSRQSHRYSMISEI